MKISDEGSTFTVVLDALKFCLFVRGLPNLFAPCKGSSKEPDEVQWSQLQGFSDALCKTQEVPWRASNTASRNQPLLSHKRLLPSYLFLKTEGKKEKPIIPDVSKQDVYLHLMRPHQFLSAGR